MGVEEFRIQGLQVHLEKEFAGGIEAETIDHFLCPCLSRQAFQGTISHTTHLKVQRVTLIKPMLHSVDCLHRVLVECIEVLDTILGEKRTCDGPVHPV